MSSSSRNNFLIYHNDNNMMWCTVYIMPDVKVALSVTRWLDYLFDIGLSTTCKIGQIRLPILSNTEIP